METVEHIIQATEDGSHTISIPSSGITYHSTKGAIRESEHVFIKTGLLQAFETFKQGEVNILEMGFGTGLNAFLTAIVASQTRCINYTSLEKHPLSLEIIRELNFTDLVGHGELFNGLHSSPWNVSVAISSHFVLHKIAGDILDQTFKQQYHLIYYDAFAPKVQPELWTEELFAKLYHALYDDGILVTYSSNGGIRRALKAAGFSVQKLKGPPGKWEIVRATKKALPV